MDVNVVNTIPLLRLHLPSAFILQFPASPRLHLALKDEPSMQLHSYSLISYPSNFDQAFFFPFSAALALAVFFLLLRIITTPRKLPTTAEPIRIRITGIRMAQTRGGK